MKELVESNIEVLQQVESFLQSLTAEQYIEISHNNQFGIGRHLRHILDMYSALQEGVLGGIVDYDKRSRGSKIESDIMAAAEALQAMIAWMQQSFSVDATINIKTEINTSKTKSTTLASTISRELCYLSSHTVHHLAYMALLARSLGVKTDPSHGVAPATASYQRSQDSQAQDPEIDPVVTKVGVASVG